MWLSINQKLLLLTNKSLVQGLLGYLKRVLTPTPLPEDDLQLMSDYLLSLETRDDLTVHVLQQTNARSEIAVVSRILLKDDIKDNFKSRATALENHWRKAESSVSGSDPEVILADHPVPPLETALPDDKPAGWKLKLGETQEAEVQREYDLFKMEKNRCVKYWTNVKPPKPMGWAPASGEAWQKVPRADIENGDLYFTPYFSPLWMSYGLAQMDAMFWSDPDITSEEEAEYRKSQAEKAELTTLSLDMRNVRKEHAESLGFTGVY